MQGELRVEFDTIENLYEYTKEHIEGKNGAIFIQFANRSVQINSRDIIGNSLQAWLPEWFRYCGVQMVENPSTQTFPDFTGIFGENKHDIEIKCWNYTSNPAFDLSNFYSFVVETYNSPEKIDADYFVLGYTPLDDEDFEQGFIVNKIFHKKIWEITKATKYPIGLQVKRGEVYAIRPFAFHRKPIESFRNRSEFIMAIRDALDMFPNYCIEFSSDEWIDRVLGYYE